MYIWRLIRAKKRLYLIENVSYSFKKIHRYATVLPPDILWGIESSLYCTVPSLRSTFPLPHSSACRKNMEEVQKEPSTASQDPNRVSPGSTCAGALEKLRP